MPRKTKTQQTAMDRLQRDLQYLTQETWIPREIGIEIPPEWHTLEHDVAVAEKKTKVTLYLDAPVARFYRAMGHGYHERINRLLSTWMNMKIADELRLIEMIEGRIGVEAYLGREVGE
jgi:uncharacterized protein (DUF4415 family)